MNTLTRKATAGVLGVVFLALALAGPASAQSAEVTGAFGDATTEMTGVAALGVALVVAAALLGIGVAFMLKWLKKARAAM